MTTPDTSTLLKTIATTMATMATSLRQAAALQHSTSPLLSRKHASLLTLADELERLSHELKNLERSHDDARLHTKDS